MPINLLFDASCTLLRLTGIGRYSLELLRAMLERWPTGEPPPTVWLNSLRHAPSPERHGFLFRAQEEGRARLIRTRFPGPVLLDAWRRLRWPPIERLAGKAGVVHSPSAYILPSRTAARVITLHDLHYMRHPTHGGRLGGRYLAETLPRSLHRVEAVIVPSNAVRREVYDHFPSVDPGRVHVIPEGVDHTRFAPRDRDAVRGVLQRLGIGDRPYVLTVATLEPRKNLPALFEAFARLWEGVSSEPGEPVGSAPPLLVGVGQPGWGRVTVQGLCETARLRPDAVLWIGHATDEELCCLYAGARVTVIPSLWEGFGLPLLEAMSCGCPVVSSSAGALPEVAGGCAALFDASSAEGLASALAEMLGLEEGRRREWIEVGRTRAQQFTWDAAAEKTLEVYRYAERAKSGAK